MTIGKQGDIDAFVRMRKLKEQMCLKYGIKEEDFQLSMGMSGDFEQAVKTDGCRLSMVLRV